MNLIEHIGRRCILPALLCLGISVNSTSALADEAMIAPAPAAPAATVTPTGKIVATVNGKPVTVREFNARYAAIMRERFYHGKPPEGQEEAVRKEVIDFLIENELLAEEAGRRGLKPDETKFEQAAATMEARYGALPEWQKDREQVLSQMKAQVGRQNLIEQVKNVLRDVPQPTSDEARAYYEQKPELFTEPEKLSLSVILLKVEPGLPRADLDKAYEKAQGIYLRLKDGADFAELARQYSGDGSADNGGKLGYAHGGMLPEKLQEKISKFQVGEVTEPIRTLEGVALYRVDDRVAPILREFAEVEPRATDLLRRDKQEQAWKEAISRLRGDAKIEILVPLADNNSKQSDSPVGAQLIVPVSSDKQNDDGKQNDSPVGAQLMAPVSSDKQSDSDKKKNSKRKNNRKKSTGKVQ